MFLTAYSIIPIYVVRREMGKLFFCVIVLYYSSSEYYVLIMRVRIHFDIKSNDKKTLENSVLREKKFLCTGYDGIFRTFRRKCFFKT